MKVAVLIPSYNMPERADALVEYIHSNIKTPVDIILIDNGSDIKEPSKYSILKLPKNIQTTGAWLEGLKYADHLELCFEEPYFAYWFLITSAEFTGGDPLTPMVEWLANNPDAVGVHPALTEDSTSSWNHMITRGGDNPRRTWFIDNIASLYRAKWFNGIGRFDPRFIYAWGIDLETCWKARCQDKSLWIDERCRVKKITNIGYTMKRMNMEADKRSELAGENMRQVLYEKYGPNYWMMMMEGNVKDEWR